MSNILVIDWSDNFLEQLKNISFAYQSTQEQIFILPNTRAKQYYTDVLAQHYFGKAFIMPKLYSYDEFISTLHLLCFENSYPFADKLDSIALLFSAIQALKNSNRFSQLELKDFYAWAIRLANLFEDYNNQMVKVKNIEHLEGDVVKFANELLGNIEDIFDIYKEKLEANKLSTQGSYVHDLAKYFQDDEEIPKPFQDKDIFFAGFVHLDLAQSIIFKSFWQAGAQFIISSDPQVCNQNAHWSCLDHIKWAKSWQTKLELYQDEKKPTKPKSESKIHYYTGYDLHSELIALNNDLQALYHEQAGKMQNAIVLAESELLLPVLHYIPQKSINGINISLGYPLKHTLLHRLILNIIALQESKNKEKYYWQHLLELCTHPYLKELKNQENELLQNSLQEVESILRHGQKMMSIEDILEKVPNTFLKNCFTYCIYNWENITTLHELSNTIAKLCEFLKSTGLELWEKDKLNNEYLFNLMHKTSPKLAHNLLTQAELNANILFSFLKEILEAERVAFEYDQHEESFSENSQSNLTNFKTEQTDLQVLGLLETRLLNFDNLFLLDLSSSNMPAISHKDPLLPDSIKKIIGLTDIQSQERIIAHNFFSSIAKSKNVYIYWQEGVESKGLFDEKKQRSRFIDELIWAEEKKNKKIYELGTYPLNMAKIRLSSQKVSRQGVEKTPEIQATLEELLNYQLSASFFSVYLQCPLNFYHSKLCKIEPLEEVNEDDDNAKLGNLIHEALHKFYKRYLNKELEKQDFTAQNIISYIQDEFSEENIIDFLSPESYLMLQESIYHKIDSYYNNHVAKTKILVLEEEMKCQIEFEKKKYLLKSRIDRIDSRNEKLIILDYKTGRVPKVNKKVWFDDGLWNQIIYWQAGDPDPLAELFEKMPSIQLALYMYIYYKEKGIILENAAFIDLAGDGKEQYLLSAKDLEEASELAQEIVESYVPNLLDFLFRHLKYAASFEANHGAHCQYCPYSIMCEGYN